METFTQEEAQKLLEESYKAITNGETVPTPEPAQVPEEEEPKPEVAPEPVEEPVTTAETENKESDDPYAWVKEIPESVRQKVMDEINTKIGLEHRIRSDDGRVRAHQEKVLKLNRIIAELQQRPTANGQPATADRQAPTTPEAWQQIVKTDPELAAAFEARVKSEVESAVGSLRNELQEFKKTAVDPLYEHTSTQYIEEQRNILRQAVPNYEQVIASPEYTEWLDKYASDGLKRLALTSTDAQDAVSIMKQFANDMVALGVYKPQPVNQTPNVASTTTRTKADEIAAARTEKLATSPVIKAPNIAPSGNPGKANYTMDEAEELFKQVYKELKTKT